MIIPFGLSNKILILSEIPKLILLHQEGYAAVNEACSLQVTEVSGTNVTSKRLTAPFVRLTLFALRSCASKNSEDRSFPRRQ